MAWIQTVKTRGGERYFIRDRRDGRQVVIAVPDGVDRPFAERMKEKYLTRRDLEKDGYFDAHVKES